MKQDLFKNIEFKKAIKLKTLITYGEGRVYSLSLAQKNQISVSLFSIDKDKDLGVHSSAGDTLITILEGKVSVKIVNNASIILEEGKTTVIPNNSSYEILAIEKSKIFVALVKPKQDLEIQANEGCGCT